MRSPLPRGERGARKWPALALTALAAGRLHRSPPMSETTTQEVSREEETVAIVGPVAEQPEASPPAEQPAEAPRQEVGQPDAQPTPAPETSAPPSGEAKLSKAQEKEAQRLVDKAV